jgi:hypothetical protein
MLTKEKSRQDILPARVYWIPACAGMTVLARTCALRTVTSC